MQAEEADAEVDIQRVKAEGEKPVFDGENAGIPAAEAKLLDASTLQPDESLAGRDLQGWTLRGDFSRRNFDGANLRRAVARCANFRNASMRGVDASRADFRGASLAGVAVHGATLQHANCMLARMAGMWSGWHTKTRPEVKADEDGTMPSVEPLAATDKKYYWAVRWAEEKAKPVDTAKDGDEDAQDETAWAAYKQEVREKLGLQEELVATLVNMQHMTAVDANMQQMSAMFANMQGMIASRANMQQMKASYANMRGVIVNGATLDHADFSRADLSPAEPSKPSAPAQPPLAVDSQPASAQEMLQALTAALAAQQPSQQTDLKPAKLSSLKSAKKTNFTNATMTRVEFDNANLAGAIFDASDVSGASMVDVTFGQYTMPAKPEAKKPAKAASRRLAMQLGKATVEAAMETAGDDDDNEDDDDANQKENSTEAQALLESMAKKGVERFASAVANAVPQVIAACEKAHKAIDAAVNEAKAALNIDSRALEAAASASTDRAAAITAIESLMRKTLGALLDEVFSEAGTLPKKELLIDAAGESSGDAGQLVQDGAELGLLRIVKTLRSTVEKHADPLLNSLASGVAEEIGGRFVPAAGAATRLRSLQGPSSKVSDQSDATEQLLDAPVLVYRKALHMLLDGVAACLDDPSVVAQQWLLQQGGKFLQGSRGGLANLGSRATAFQKVLTSKLTEEHAKMVGGESLGKQLNTHVRSQTAKRALAGASRYAATGHAAMLKLVLSTDPLALTKDEKELTYVLEELGKLKDADVTSELWQDFYESWASFLSLRPKLGAECAQQIFDAIATDDSVLAGLAAAHSLKDAVMKSGQVPNGLLLHLKQGPGKHIKNHAYAYRRKVDAELTKIGRIRDLQQRAVALTGTALIAAFVSIGNVLARLYYDVLRVDSTMAGIIAGVAIGTMLLVCILVAACVRRVRK